MQDWISTDSYHNVFLLIVNDLRVNSAPKILIASETWQPLNIPQPPLQGNIEIMNIGRNRTLPKAGESNNNWNASGQLIYNLLEDRTLNPSALLALAHLIGPLFPWKIMKKARRAINIEVRKSHDIFTTNS